MAAVSAAVSAAALAAEASSERSNTVTQYSRHQLVQAAREAARRHGLRPRLFKRQIGAESNFDPSAHSGAGAVGIAQIMPGTAAAWHVNASDPIAALNVAAAHMADLVRKYGEEGALRAYNAGEGAIKASHAYPETNAYVAKILGGLPPAGKRKARGASTMAKSMLIPGRAKQNVDVAILDILATHKPGSTLKQLDSLLSSGRYDTVTPAHRVAVPHVTGQKQQAGSHGAPRTSTSGGVVMFEGKPVAAWMVPALKYARRHGWKGSITSGVRTRAEQQQLWDNRASNPNPVARPGTSNHEIDSGGGGAIDASDPNGLERALAGYNGVKPVRDPSINDPVHFSRTGR